MSASRFPWHILISVIANPILLYVAYKLSQLPFSSAPPPVPPTEVLFFPDEGIECPRLNTTRGCLDQKCRFKHTPQSLARLAAVIGSAKVSLDVCMFVIGSQQLMDQIVDAHKRGVKVRCVSDNQDMDGVLRRLRSNGVMIRFDKSDYLMHHKFVVVDCRVVITGSYNFSRSGMGVNRENVVIVHFPNIVASYLEEFDTMWLLYGSKKFSYNFRNSLVYEGTG